MTFTTLDTLETYRGESQTLSLAFTDDSSNPIDISSYTILFTVKRVLDADATDADAAITLSGTVLSGSGGTASISLASTDTLIDIGDYYYDIKYLVGSVENVIGVGKFKVKYPATNRDS